MCVDPKDWHCVTEYGADRRAGEANDELLYEQARRIELARKQNERKEPQMTKGEFGAKAVVLAAALVVTASAFGAVGLLTIPANVTNCETNKMLEVPASLIPSPWMDGAGTCSTRDYTNCVSACVDESLPWRILTQVNCSYIHYSRSYYTVSCECHYVSASPPITGPRMPIDVGFGFLTR